MRNNEWVSPIITANAPAPIVHCQSHISFGHDPFTKRLGFTALVHSNRIYLFKERRIVLRNATSISFAIPSLQM
jgi:hypothetical protein